jgi:putative membrane protein
MRNLSIALAAALLILGCAASHSTMTSSTSSPGMPGMAMLSDADIAGIVSAANQGEIDEAGIANGKASSAEVRAFAQMMITDHTAALNAARDLFTRRGITANMTDTTASQLASGAQQTVSNLSTYSGAAFDRAYMQSQVDTHQWLLNQLDSTLIPSAHNRELRQLLTTQRGAVAAHLDRARQIMGALR